MTRSMPQYRRRRWAGAHARTAWSAGQNGFATSISGLWLRESAMNQFEVAQGFVEQCQAGVPVGVLAQAFQRCTETLGFRHYACCSHVDPLKPPRRAVM